MNLWWLTSFNVIFIISRLETKDSGYVTNEKFLIRTKIWCLLQVSVPIVSNDRCKSMFLRAGRHEFIPDIFLCAGYESGGQDSCQVSIK